MSPVEIIGIVFFSLLAFVILGGILAGRHVTGSFRNLVIDLDDSLKGWQKFSMAFGLGAVVLFFIMANTESGQRQLRIAEEMNSVSEALRQVGHSDSYIDSEVANDVGSNDELVRPIALAKVSYDDQREARASLPDTSAFDLIWFATSRESGDYFRTADVLAKRTQIGRGHIRVQLYGMLVLNHPEIDKPGGSIELNSADEASLLKLSHVADTTLTDGRTLPVLEWTAIVSCESFESGGWRWTLPSAEGAGEEFIRLVLEKETGITLSSFMGGFLQNVWFETTSGRNAATLLSMKYTSMGGVPIQFPPDVRAQAPPDVQDAGSSPPGFEMPAGE